MIKSIEINSRVLLLSGRRYGDASIAANLLRAASQVRPDIKWIIWTRNEYNEIFQHANNSSIILNSTFPISGGVKDFLSEAGYTIIKTILKARALKIDYSLDLVGDFRESFLGFLISGKNHYSPSWEPPHMMSRLIWKVKVPSVNYIQVPFFFDNIYHSLEYFFSQIGFKIKFKESPLRSREDKKIGIHTFSSHSFKEWPYANWIKLIRKLNADGFDLFILCSPNQTQLAKLKFNTVLDMVTIISKPKISELMDFINELDVLIGVDSFLIHLAFYLNKKVVSINAGNPSNAWAPPLSKSLSNSGGCKSYPCFNAPVCLGSFEESKCIKSIDVDDVYKSFIARDNLCK